ncbi:MAG: glutathione S-transferase family protein [Alphaproteobacteria bacterium]|nr:glutathione S-transferase family protein [Alphaproteobacteria bacterium]
MPPLPLYLMSTCWGLPNPSPFVLKLMTWLRMADIPYEAHVLKGPPRSPTGKIPYVIDTDGQLLYDTSRIIAHLTQTRGVALDQHLSPEQRARGLASQRLLEDHLYWVTVTDRWRTPLGWSHTRLGYFGGLPWPLRWLVPPLARRGVRQALHGQGFGRMPLEDVWARGDADLEALTTLLGEQPFLLGEPSSVDAAAYGLLANILAQPWDSPLKASLQSREPLLRYVARIRERWWAD